MSVSAELEVPYEKGPEQATGVKVCVHSNDFRHYVQHKLDFGEALQLLNDLTKALQSHREAVNGSMVAAETELASQEQAAA